jgi:hypothetical protein
VICRFSYLYSTVHDFTSLLTHCCLILSLEIYSAALSSRTNRTMQVLLWYNTESGTSFSLLTPLCMWKGSTWWSDQTEMFNDYIRRVIQYLSVWHSIKNQSIIKVYIHQKVRTLKSLVPVTILTLSLKNLNMCFLQLWKAKNLQWNFRLKIESVPSLSIMHRSELLLKF